MTMSSTHDIYIVDVCGTLVREDTTIGLLRYHFARIKSRPIRYMLFIVMTAPVSPLRLVYALLEKLTSRHILKHALVKLLVNDRVEQLNQSAIEYAKLLLAQSRVSSVWNLVGVPAEAGRVVLASASLEPVVAALASAIGARHVASALAENEGVLTGRYASDLTGRKEQAMIDKYGCDLLIGRVCAISDNFTDRPLLAKATKAFVVLHSESHRQRWDGLEAIFLQVDE